MNLSEHFTLEQLTRTDHADLQEENRNVTAEEEKKLAACAHLLEQCRAILGVELDVHSGKRCLSLNKRVGGSERSQHLKCEAVDFSPAGPDTPESISHTFLELLSAATQGKLKFGQLMAESASYGREGRKNWVHISLGAPYRDQSRCGEALKMKDGKYVAVAKVNGL